MADIQLNSVTLATESGGTVTVDSAVAGIPAAGVTGVLPNAVQDNITRLGTVTTDLTLTGDLVPSTPLSHRNMIINGGMRVRQRGTSFSPATTLTHLIDRFRSAHGGSFNFDTTITQVATGFNETGQTYCMKVEADSVVSPTGTHNGGILYPVEGQDLQHLQYGGSNAKDMVLSFWAKVSANAVGTYTVQPRFTDPSGGYHSQYHAISLTTTWTQYEILIPASGSALTHAIKNNNELGLEILWFLCTGVDDIVSASSTWNDISAYRGVTGSANFLDSADNEFYLTGVQLELGSNATPFEHRTLQDDILACQRYYYVIGSHRNYIAGRTSNTDAMYCAPSCPVPMRSTPSIGNLGSFSINCIHSEGGATSLNSTPTIDVYPTGGIYDTIGVGNIVGNIGLFGGSGLTDGRVCSARINGGLTFDAEL